MEKRYGYVEFLLDKEEIDFFKSIVKNIVPKEQFYFSESVPRIAGDVSSKAHFTLFYGLETREINNPELKDLVLSVKVNEVKIKNLELWNGYQNLYRILCIEIDDSDKILFNFFQNLLKFSHSSELAKREFKPHITLAYVQNSFQLPESYILPKQTIRIRETRLAI